MTSALFRSVTARVRSEHGRGNARLARNPIPGARVGRVVGRSLFTFGTLARPFSALSATEPRGVGGRPRPRPLRDVSNRPASLGPHLGVRGGHAPPVGRASPARAARRPPVADARSAAHRRSGEARRLRERGFLERRRVFVAERERRPVRLRVVVRQRVPLSRVRVHGTRAQHLLRGVRAEQRVQRVRHRRRRRRRATRGPGARLRRRRRPQPPAPKVAERPGRKFAARRVVVRRRRPGGPRRRPPVGRGHGHETKIRPRVGARFFDDAPGRPRAPFRPAASERGQPRDRVRPERAGQLLRHSVRSHERQPVCGRVRRPVRARV